MCSDAEGATHLMPSLVFWKRVLADLEVQHSHHVRCMRSESAFPAVFQQHPATILVLFLRFLVSVASDPHLECFLLDLERFWAPFLHHCSSVCDALGFFWTPGSIFVAIL